MFIQLMLCSSSILHFVSSYQEHHSNPSSLHFLAGDVICTDSNTISKRILITKFCGFTPNQQTLATSRSSSQQILCTPATNTPLEPVRDVRQSLLPFLSSSPHNDSKQECFSHTCDEKGFGGSIVPAEHS